MAQVPGFSRSQPGIAVSDLPKTHAHDSGSQAEAKRPKVGTRHLRTPICDECPRRPPPVLGRGRVHVWQRQHVCCCRLAPRRSPLLLHTLSGAMQLSSFGSFHADSDVVRYLSVSPIAILPGR